MAPNKVVVIDDDVDVALYLKLILQDHGFEVQVATSGDEGLEIIKLETPDLICLDILMPRKTGLSLFRTLKTTAELQTMPVLIVSGLGLETEIRQYLQGLPAPDGYLEKPVTADDLVEAVTTLLQERETLT